MNRPDLKKRLVFLLAAVLLPAAALLFFARRDPHAFAHRSLPAETRRFPVMGTVAEIKLAGADPAASSRAADAVLDTILKIESICNIYDPASELSRLNASAAASPFVCSALLWDVLLEARRFHRVSGGAFDVTVKPLMALWGFHRKRATLPSEAEIAAAKLSCGLDKVVFDDRARTVAFPREGFGIDLGGIAKGYALDRAAAVALGNGAECGFINLGGNIRCLPKPFDDGRPFYRIGVRDPFGGTECAASVEMLGNSISTSGNYERYVTIGGVRWTHIVDPRSGRPVERMLSVSVVSPRGVDSDALSTAVFINGPDFAREIAAAFKDTHILVWYSDGRGKTLVSQFGGVWKNVKKDFGRKP